MGIRFWVQPCHERQNLIKITHKSGDCLQEIHFKYREVNELSDGKRYTTLVPIKVSYSDHRIVRKINFKEMNILTIKRLIH